MAPDRIASLDDVRAVERGGVARWMPFEQVLDALGDVARRHPERPALTALPAADGQPLRRWTHRQLQGEIHRCAHLFRSLVAPEDTPRVALLLPPLPEAWFTLWGAEAVGVACPINPALSDEHLLALLAATGANLIVTLAPEHAAGDIGGRVLRLRDRCPALRAVLTVGGAAAGTLDFDAARVGLSPQTPEVAPAPERVAALFHTGGTTGLPKLAQQTQLNQLHAAWGAARLFDASPQDVILNGFPLFHVAGAFVYGLSMLLAGAEVLLPPPAGWRDAAFAARAWPLIRAHRVSVLAMVPTVMTALLAAPRERHDAAGVRLGLTGGSPLPPELASRFEAETGVAVRNIFGMTECAGVIAIEPAAAPRTPGSCGLPLPFSEVGVDADGVLRVRGPNVGPGYTDPARNIGAFEDDWLMTGDIGHVDDQGRVFVTGRAKDVIIRGAHNIDPGVIEEALLQHPLVALAAAVGEPDEYAGELPMAYVVARPGEPVDTDALAAFLRPLIPERAAMPRRIMVVPALPLTAIGKVYKPALRLQAAVRVIGERVQAAGLAGQVEVSGEDRGGQMVLRLRCLAEDDVLVPRLRTLMAGFALAWELA